MKNMLSAMETSRVLVSTASEEVMKKVLTISRICEPGQKEREVFRVRLYRLSRQLHSRGWLVVATEGVIHSAGRRLLAEYSWV